MIEAKGIYKSFGKLKVLKGIDLRVKNGEILGIIGPNGAGKTTLMRIMAGIKSRDKGKVLLMGTDPLKDHKIKKRIGFMPERVYFEDEMKGEKFLKIMGRFWSIKRNRIYELLEKCGIKEASKRKIKSYSKGMVQRILLAQSLINDPDLLFLDEPNSGIDPTGTKEIRDIIIKMNQKGKTFIINSHQLTELEKICSRVVFLKAGKLVAEINMKDQKEEYSIEIRGDNIKVDNIIKELKLNYESNDYSHYTISIPEKEKKDIIFRKFIDEGIEIEAFKKKEADLESLFFKYVEEDKK